MTTDVEARDNLLIQASAIIADEQPAIVLFQPEFVYVVNSEVTAMLPRRPGKPAD